MLAYEKYMERAGHRFEELLQERPAGFVWCQTDDSILFTEDEHTLYKLPDTVVLSIRPGACDKNRNSVLCDIWQRMMKRFDDDGRKVDLLPTDKKSGRYKLVRGDLGNGSGVWVCRAYTETIPAGANWYGCGNVLPIMAMYETVNGFVPVCMVWPVRVME